MSLVNVHADLNRTATALERIADCLEKLCPPIYPQANAKEPSKEYTIDKVDNEATYLQETEDQLNWYVDKVRMLAEEYGDKLSEPERTEHL
jgi:hypothetical protein